MYITDIAERTVKQWDNHDKYRVPENEKSGEPDDVAIARLLVDLSNAIEDVQDWSNTRIGEMLDRQIP